MLGLIGVLFLSVGVNLLTGDHVTLGVIMLGVGFVVATGGFINIWRTYKKERALELTRAIRHIKSDWVPTATQFYCLISCAGDSAELVEETVKELVVVAKGDTQPIATLTTGITRDANLRAGQYHYAGSYDPAKLAACVVGGIVHVDVMIPSTSSAILDRYGIEHDLRWPLDQGPAA